MLVIRLTVFSELIRPNLVKHVYINRRTGRRFPRPEIYSIRSPPLSSSSKGRVSGRVASPQRRRFVVMILSVDQLPEGRNCLNGFLRRGLRHNDMTAGNAAAAAEKYVVIVNGDVCVPCPNACDHARPTRRTVLELSACACNHLT